MFCKLRLISTLLELKKCAVKGHRQGFYIVTLIYKKTKERDEAVGCYVIPDLCTNLLLSVEARAEVKLR